MTPKTILSEQDNQKYKTLLKEQLLNLYSLEAYMKIPEGIVKDIVLHWDGTLPDIIE